MIHAFRRIAAILPVCALACLTTMPLAAQTSSSSSSNGGSNGTCTPAPAPADSGCAPVDVSEPDTGAIFAMAIAGLIAARMLGRRRKD